MKKTQQYIKSAFLYTVLSLNSFTALSHAREAQGSQVVFETNMGRIELSLNSKKAPMTVSSFLKQVDNGYYNGTLFHRVTSDFIQGGCFVPNMLAKPVDWHVSNEADNLLKNTRGTIAMARKNHPHSAKTDFFINLKDNAHLDFKSKTQQGWGYTVFGQVIKGMDIVDKIATIPTHQVKEHNDVPENDVIILKAYQLYSH